MLNQFVFHGLGNKLIQLILVQIDVGLQKQHGNFLRLIFWTHFGAIRTANLQLTILAGSKGWSRSSRFLLSGN